MDPASLSYSTYALLALAGFAGGLIDAIAGGGGLITVPALMAAGLPPQIALGTNKLQSCCGTLLAVKRYAGAGLLATPGLPLAAGCSLVAGAAGAWAVTKVSADALRQLIPFLLAAVAIYTAMHRQFGLTTSKPLLGPVVFGVSAGLLLGFYDGFFGPGTGAFWTVGLVGLMGLELRMATGYTKAVNLASNLGALVLFLGHGMAHLPAAAVMICGQLLGAALGSGLVIGRGQSVIRPVFLGVVGVLTVKLMYDALAA